MPGRHVEARTKKPTKAGKAGRAAAARKPPAKAAPTKAPAKPKPAVSRKSAAPKPASGRPAPRTPASKAPKTTARTKPAATPPAPRPAPKAVRAPATAKAAPPRPARPATVAKASASGPIDRLHQVALVATDLGAAIAFYGDVLGLRFIARFDPPGLAFFDLGGGSRLMLSATASSATLYFNVKDVDQAVKTLSGRGVRFLHKPSLVHRDDQGHFGKKGAAEWMAFFKDPSQNLIAIVERRQAPTGTPSRQSS